MLLRNHSEGRHPLQETPGTAAYRPQAVALRQPATVKLVQADTPGGSGGGGGAGGSGGGAGFGGGCGGTVTQVRNRSSEGVPAVLKLNQRVYSQPANERSMEQLTFDHGRQDSGDANGKAKCGPVMGLSRPDVGM